ncbi:RmlC-like cupin domain-containing protein [Phyllosticta citriasiana]|uniref:RmlC-like cupin domain-containing protein n=1 Tax=Phyllosticta citriasiana TaxID=595635 RepID=UPI0030FD522F
MRYILTTISLAVCLFAAILALVDLPALVSSTTAATITAANIFLTRCLPRSLARPAFSSWFNLTAASSRTMATNGNSNATPFQGLPVIPPNDPALAKPEQDVVPRRIQQKFLAIEQAEGAGARVRRSVGTAKLRNFSPFLMLDHFTISPGAGFPDHPHRGQETITYLLQGAVDHEDFAGNKGRIETGDLQFMTAGRGIMHAEMPVANADGTPNVGMQLWVDLPRRLKNCEPRYRDLRAAEIPVWRDQEAGIEVKVISGRRGNVESVAELAYTPVWLLDVTMRPGARLVQNLPASFNAFAYMLSGAAAFSDGPASTGQTQLVPQYHNVVFGQDGDGVVASVPADAAEPARFILVAGLPLDQPIVQYGPFVVSSREEVYQAMMDFRGFANGFERARDWESEIGKSMAF